MKYYDWNQDKNELLKNNRGLCFEDIVYFIEKDMLLDIFYHPDQKKYPGQRIYIVNVNDYAYIVPFVMSGEKIFLKTIIPSRKATRKYLRKKGDKNEAG